MSAAAFSGDFAKLQKLIDGVGRLASKSGFMRRCYKQLGEEAVNQVHESFATGSDPYGSPWKPPQHREGQPLRDTGRLMNSFRYRLLDNGFVVGSNVVYARIHNYGGSIVIPPRVMAHNSDTGRFIRRTINATRQPQNQVQGARATRVSFRRPYTLTMPKRQFLPSPPRLGTRWTSAMAAVLVAQRKLELGR